VFGCVSLFMEISSEIIHSPLPMFLMASLGASTTTIGLIEGIAEATAPIVKVFPGTLSDNLGNRKWLAVAGYGLGALSKPLFAVAPTIGIVVTARIMDRVGKGIRGAPRDARGRCHATTSARCCIRTSSVSGHVGAFLEPLLAVVIMLVWADSRSCAGRVVVHFVCR
jgi:MFS family permease